MESFGRDAGKGIRKRPAGSGKRHENEKKMLNRGNELKDVLETKDLAYF
jgi:hypothetical protein